MRESDTNSDLRSKNVETGTRSVDHGIIKISFLRSPTRIEIYTSYAHDRFDASVSDTHILVKIRISIEGNKVQRGPRKGNSLRRVKSSLLEQPQNETNDSRKIRSLVRIYDDSRLFLGSNGARQIGQYYLSNVTSSPFFFIEKFRAKENSW